jgi:hypothetical protein
VFLVAIAQDQRVINAATYPWQAQTRLKSLFENQRDPNQFHQNRMAFLFVEILTAVLFWTWVEFCFFQLCNRDKRNDEIVFDLESEFGLIIASLQPVAGKVKERAL